MSLQPGSTRICTVARRGLSRERHWTVSRASASRSAPVFWRFLRSLAGRSTSQNGRRLPHSKTLRNTGHVLDCEAHRASRAAAFSLVELMIVMVLLSVIVLGLLAVFNQTTRAFKTGMAQVDVMEGGRSTMDLITRDVVQMAFAPRALGSNMINFQNFTPQGYRELTQALPGTSAVRTNILQEFFFLRRDQQNWVGTAYFVQDFDLDGVGTLYRFTTNVPARELSPFRDPYAIYRSLTAQEFRTQSSRIADGVVHFKVTPFGLDGWALEPGSEWGIDTNSFNVRVLYDSTPSGVRTEFVNGAIPTGLEIELAVVEEEVLRQVEGLPSVTPAQAIRRNYLYEQGGKTHVFKQQVAIRNADERWYRR